MSKPQLVKWQEAGQRGCGAPGRSRALSRCTRGSRLTDSTGTVQATYTYDAYGNTAGRTGTAVTSLRYAGEYLDSESNLYYLRARYYDPSTGQFISRDPAVATTKEPYAYGGDTPLNNSDPSGLWGFGGLVCAQGEAGLAIVGAAANGCMEKATLSGNNFDEKTYFCRGAFAGGNAEFADGRRNWGPGMPDSGPVTGPRGVFGEDLEIGASLMFTNASTDIDLEGPFHTTNIGHGQFGISWQTSVSDSKRSGS